MRRIHLTMNNPGSQNGKTGASVRARVQKSNDKNSTQRRAQEYKRVKIKIQRKDAKAQRRKEIENIKFINTYFVFRV